MSSISAPALLVVAGLLLTIPSTAAPKDPPLQCAVVDTLSLAPFAFPEMTREVTMILAAVGIHTRWRALGAGQPEDTNGPLVILLPRSAGTHSPFTLGAVSRSGRATEAAWIYLEPVATAVGLDLHDMGAWTPGERGVFARALGRIAAHELVHVLLPDLPHSSEGLMRASISGRSLGGGVARLDKATSLALHDWVDAESAREALTYREEAPVGEEDPPAAVPRGR